jgi:transposase
LYEQSDRIPEILGAILSEMYAELQVLDEKIDQLYKQFERLTNADPVCRKLKKLKGIGLLAALALIVKVGDAHIFKNGRELSSYFGLVDHPFNTPPTSISVSSGGSLQEKVRLLS